MKSFKPLIIISGPTASGKTSLSLEIAKHQNCEIINFDSLLFYKELNIGVAKPSETELASAIHHYVSFRSITNPLNAHEFSKLAIAKINEIQARDITPILVGGSGFYLQAILQGMYNSNPSTELTRNKSDSLYKKEGIKAFLEILKSVDPESFERYHPNDHYRIRRAVEYFWDNNSPLSQARSIKDKKNVNQSEWPQKKFNWSLLHLYLNIPKSKHEEIIKKRTHKMINDGLVAEVKELIKLHPNPDLYKPLQSIGYKESIAYLKGLFSSEEEFVERINISTRQLAKAQRTWFSKKEKEVYNPLTEKEEIFKRVQRFLRH